MKETIEQLVKDWKINHARLAAKMNMPLNTFKNKINPNMKNQYFSLEEKEKLIEILQDLSYEINSTIVFGK